MCCWYGNVDVLDERPPRISLRPFEQAMRIEYQQNRTVRLDTRSGDDTETGDEFAQSLDDDVALIEQRIDDESELADGAVHNNERPWTGPGRCGAEHGCQLAHRNRLPGHR